MCGGNEGIRKEGWRRNNNVGKKANVIMGSGITEECNKENGRWKKFSSNGKGKNELRKEGRQILKQ